MREATSAFALSKQARGRVLISVVALVLAGATTLQRVWTLRQREASPDAWTLVQQRGRLIVGTNPTYMPLSGYAGDYTGLEPEIMREVARRLQVVLQFEPTGGDGQYEGLELGLVDAMASQIVVDPRYLGRVRYSTPYFDAGQVLVVPRGSPVVDVSTLAGHRVAVELGSDGDQVARRLAFHLPGGLVLVHTDGPDAALDEVTAGRTDAAIVDRISALQQRQRSPQLEILPEPVSEVPYAVVTRRDSPELARRIEAALQAMRADGTLQALVDYWVR